LPDGRFDSEDRQPAKLRLVKGPVPSPCEAEHFPFRFAVVIATIVLAAGAVGAHLWILPSFYAGEEEDAAPVVQVRHADLLNEERREPIVRVVRLEAAQPVAPRTPTAIPAAAARPEKLVQADWERSAEEPYDPSDLLEEAVVPFPPAEEEPKVVKKSPRRAKPKKSEPKESRRAGTRPKTTPKPAAKGPSRPARDLKRYRPPYPGSARRAGVEGRVVLSVQVRTDGRIGSVRVASSSGSAVLDSAAISAVKRWKFAPELKNGKAVTSTVNVPFTFDLK